DGTFQAPQAFQVGDGPRSVAVADFNGDGLPDIVSANSFWFDGISSSDNVSVLSNDGNWGFHGPPGIALSDAAAVEGNTGTVSAVFTLRLSAPSTQTVSVRYATADGTAIAGSDYTATAWTVTFAPGETSKTISIP